jgi:hypothetical protein
MTIELISGVFLVGTLVLILYAYLLLRNVEARIGLTMMHLDGIYAKIRKNSRLSALEQSATRLETKD